MKDLFRTPRTYKGEIHWPRYLLVKLLHTFMQIALLSGHLYMILLSFVSIERTLIIIIIYYYY